ncbi:MAG: cytochrome-c peroxidase [Planctomycetota bacterium]
MTPKTVLALSFSLSVLAGCGSDPADGPHGGGSNGTAGGGSNGAASADPLQAPLGLDGSKLVLAENNELTAEKAALGKKLFFDPRLSASGEMGCVNCHYPDKAFTDGLQHSKKDSGKMNSRNSPTMYNVGYYPHLYWDGRKVGLESNVLAAWTGQLGGKPAEVAEKLNGVAAYKEEFQAAFGKDASEETIVHALCSFLRTLRTGNSAYDKFVAGDKDALTKEQQDGHALFLGKAGCVVCHTPPLFSNAPMNSYHNVGIGMGTDSEDLGRAKATKKSSDNGKFKTPTLREVARTAPYFHDGSVATLKEAVTIMAGGGIANSNKDPLLMDRALSDAEIDQLVAFLGALNGDVAWTDPVLPK